ncbi:MAG: nucleotidyltransferase family protein [Bacilli bacterium]
MTILGLVLELNPFHRGHVYFIQQAKKLSNPDFTIAVLSGNYAMRGEVMVTNKWERSQLLLDYGVDLIMELPYLGTNGSADYFCYNTVKILTDMGMNHLAFGVELDQLSYLKTIKTIQYSHAFDPLMQTYLKQGLSYSGASNKAMMELSKDELIRTQFSLPNNTLAIGYLHALDTLNPTAKVTLVKRIGNQYFDTTLNNTSYSSATSLRESLRSNQDISAYVPTTRGFYNPALIEERLFSALQYIFATQSIEQLETYLGIDEGIEHRFAKFILESSTYLELITHIQTRRYPINRIRRMILNILLQIPKHLERQYHTYLRILALNNAGKAYLKTLSKSTKQQLITSFKNKQGIIIDTELKASKLYGYLVGNPTLYLEEFRVPKGELQHENQTNS